MLAELDPAAYDALLAQKARKKEQEAAANDFEDHRQKVKAEERQREEMTQVEAALIRAEQWDHTIIEYGGRRMSQADSDKTRDYMLNNPDDVVAYGMKNGYFKTREEGLGFLRLTGRVRELDRMDRAGTITEEQKAEMVTKKKLEQSYSTVSSHFDDERSQVMTHATSPQAFSMPVSASPPPTAATNDDNQFRAKAPNLVGAFAMQAGVPKEPQAQPVPENLGPMPTAAKARILELS